LKNDDISELTQNNRKLSKLWITIAFILVIICIAALFLLNDKIKLPGEKKDTPDQMFISAYPVDSMTVANFIQAKTSKNTVTQDSIVNANETGSINKHEHLPVEKKKLTDRIEEKRKSEKEKDFFLEKEYNFNYANDYGHTISNEEIQAIISEGLQEKIKTNNNISQTSKPVAGDKAFNDYIEENCKSLSDNVCGELHGKVILLFTVNDKGRPVNVSILRSLCQAADREAVKLLQNGPNWTVSDQLARVEVAF